MPATFSYFYTVTADTDYKEYFDTAEQGTLTQEEWLKFDDLTEQVHSEVRPTGGTGNKEGVYTGPKTEVAPYATTIKVKKQMKVIYYLRFYMKEVNAGQPTKYYWLNDNSLKNVTITAASSKFYKYSGVYTVKPGDKGYIKSKYPAVAGVSEVYGRTSGHCFVFTMYVKEANFKLDTGFTVTAKFTPSDFEFSNTTPNPSSDQVTITNAMIAGLNPAINCTQGVVEPKPNKNFLEALQDVGPNSGFYTQPVGSALVGSEKDVSVVQTAYAYNSCAKSDDKRWIGVKWGRVVADRKKIKVKYVIYYGSKSGQGFDANKFKPAFDDVTQGTGRITSPDLEAALKLVIDARVGNCADPASGGSSEEDKKTVIVRPVPPKDKLRWNPPPHIEARSVNYANRLGGSPLFKNQRSGDEALRNELFYFYSQDLKGNRFERGKIFQDKITAKVMNNVKGLSVIPKKADVLQWGYQFMYNPETISYTTSDGSGIDWTYGSKDKSVVISGSQNITFDLLINRIPDMSYLTALYGEGANQSRYNQVTPTAAYGRPLEDVEIQGILKRGTEYDIEFLYRVLTGDPLPKSLLLESGYAGTALTSDIGYITKVPVWLYLHDNMRFFGSVASISVMHRIFDQNMVPTLTRMSVTFNRYPAFPGKAPITTSTTSTTGN